jgi:hypothetical protein
LNEANESSFRVSASTSFSIWLRYCSTSGASFFQSSASRAIVRTF